MLTEIALQDLLRTGIYLVAGGVAFAFTEWLVLFILGFPFAKIRDKLDDNPVAIGILFAGNAVGLGILFGSILH